jgi:HK97 family phage portal protein
MASNSLAILGRDWRYPVVERRSSLENPQTPLSYPAEWLLDLFNGGRTDSGIRVSELTAFSCITFLSGVDFIAGKISSLPFHVYERMLVLNGRRAAHRTAYEHDYYDLIATEPNEEMSRQTLWKAFLCHCLAWGNGYIEMQRDEGNDVVALWPRNPAKTRPRRAVQPLQLAPVPWRPFPVLIPVGRLYFETSDGMEDQDTSHEDAQSRSMRAIPLEDMLHVPGLALDGRLGQSVVWLARQTLGLALATEKFGAKYFANFARPGGILKMPMNMPDAAKTQARNSWMEAQGGENANRIAVMAPGFEWTPMSNNPEEAQTIQTRAFIRSELAALLHLPNRVLGDQSRSSRASTEQENQEILDFSLMPWISMNLAHSSRKVRWISMNLAHSSRKVRYSAVRTESLETACRSIRFRGACPSIRPKARALGS